jgi:hypothetical protein
MKLGLDENNRIIEVNEITEKSVKVIDIEENEDFPFYNEDESIWSNEKLLTYCYEVKEGSIQIYPFKVLES